MNIMSLKEKAQKLKLQTLTVYFAARDPNMPILIKLLAIMIAAYALSPIDLIPDFIPIIGYLDDLVIIPLGLALVIRFTPHRVMASAKYKASQLTDRPVSYAAAAFCIFVWIAVLYLSMKWIYLVYIS